MPQFLFPLTAHHLSGEVRILTTISEFELFCQRHQLSEHHIFHSSYIDPTCSFIRTSPANYCFVLFSLCNIFLLLLFVLPYSHSIHLFPHLLFIFYFLFFPFP